MTRLMLNRLSHPLTRLFTAFLIMSAWCYSSVAIAKMTPKLLFSTITQYAENVQQEGNLIGFSYKGIGVYCIFDAKADRMRLISPIIEVEKVPQEALIVALQANYHSVLDARYAIGNGLVHAAFIHPLSPLSVPELESAIRQVSHAALTFGDEYSSGELFFPGQQQPRSEGSQPKQENIPDKETPAGSGKS